jgi:hypothetical protein
LNRILKNGLLDFQKKGGAKMLFKEEVEGKIRITVQGEKLLPYPLNFLVVYVRMLLP